MANRANLGSSSQSGAAAALNVGEEEERNEEAARDAWKRTVVTRDWLRKQFDVVKPTNVDKVFEGLTNCGVEDVADLIEIGLSEPTKKFMKQVGIPLLAGAAIERFAREATATATAAPQTFDQAFAAFSRTIVWPDSIDAFTPRPVQLNRANPLARSVYEAKVCGSFKDPSEPDFLLTEMFQPIRYDRFCGIGIVAGEDSYLDRTRPFDEAVMDGAKALVVVGTSGSGKTLYTLQRSVREYAALLVCDTKGNGGSQDVRTILRKAEALHEIQNTAPPVRQLVERELDKLLRFRSKMLDLCCERYPEFLPIHWLIAQLYSTQIFGKDIFHGFMTTAIASEDYPSLRTGKLTLIVLDEAQMADTLLLGTFPSKTKPGLMRSLLAPLVQCLSDYTGQLIVCGTGLSAASVYETTISPLKKGVATRMFGVATFFNEDDIQFNLRNWGITDEFMVDRSTCGRFIGRPRHCAYLANDCITSGGTPNAAKVERGFVELYQDMLQKTRRLSVADPRRDKQTNDEEDLYYHLRTSALEYILGKPGVVTNDPEAALQYGVCALRDVDDDGGGDAGAPTQSSSSSSSQKRQKVYRAVLAEPLLVAALVDNAVSKFEQHFLHRSHSHIGFLFEEYLALRAPDFGDCVHRGAIIVSDQVDVYRAELGKPTKRGASLTEKTRDDLETLFGEFTDLDDARRKLESGRLVLEAFQRDWEFLGSTSTRFAVRCNTAGEEATYLQRYLTQRRSVVIFPSEAMGPDLIILLWKDATPLVVLVQAKSGKRYSTPEAILVLEQLYETNRVAGKVVTNPRATSFNAVVKQNGGLTARIVIKPLEGAIGKSVEFADGEMLIVLHKNSWEGLMLVLKCGIENLGRFKAAQ